MRKRTDDDMPRGKLTAIPDFLPSPQQLVFPKPKTVKITLSLTKSSVDIFKKYAKTYNVKYQQMIRTVVDKYAHKF